MDHSSDTDKALQTQVTDLQSELQEKEELVAALTERLEQAAEQLDRIHRTGGDRGIRTGGGGLPPELVEQQQTLTEDLQRAVEQWEAMQAGAALGRLESQVSELRDLVAGRVLESNLAGRPHPDPGSHDEAPAAEPADETEPAEDQPSGLDSSSYEAFKAAMMQTGESSASEDEAPSPAEAPADAAAPADTAVQQELDALEPVDPPDSIDLESAEPDDLRRAVEERDAYITWLIKRLRVAELRGSGSGDWKSLEDVPDELRARLEELETTLEEHLRLAEVEQSVERARLAREEGRLRMQEQQLEKEMKRHGLDRGPESGAAGGPGAPEEVPEKDRMSKWLKLLGRSKTDERSGPNEPQDS